MSSSVTSASSSLANVATAVGIPQATCAAINTAGATVATGIGNVATAATSVGSSIGSSIASTASSVGSVIGGATAAVAPILGAALVGGIIGLGFMWIIGELIDD